MKRTALLFLTILLVSSSIISLNSIEQAEAKASSILINQSKQPLLNQDNHSNFTSSNHPPYMQTNSSNLPPLSSKLQTKTLQSTISSQVVTERSDIDIAKMTNDSQFNKTLAEVNEDNEVNKSNLVIAQGNNNGNNTKNLIKNGDFEEIPIGPSTEMSLLETNWLFNSSYLAIGSSLTPKWPSQVALLGIYCSSQVKNYQKNRIQKLIQQNFTLENSESLRLNFNYGLVTTQNAILKVSTKESILLFVTFNGQTITYYTYQKISQTSLNVAGVKGVNTLSFHAVRTGLECKDTLYISIDNITISEA